MKGGKTEPPKLAAAATLGPPEVGLGEGVWQSTVHEGGRQW